MSATLCDNLLAWLAAQGVGVAAVSLWSGQFPPEGDGVLVQDTGGTQTSFGRQDSMRTFFVVARSADLETAKDKAWEIFGLLDLSGKLRLGSGPTSEVIFESQAIQPPFQLGGQDDRQRWSWAANYQITIRRH